MGKLFSLHWAAGQVFWGTLVTVTIVAAQTWSVYHTVTHQSLWWLIWDAAFSVFLGWLLWRGWKKTAESYDKEMRMIMEETSKFIVEEAVRLHKEQSK